MKPLNGLRENIVDGIFRVGMVFAWYRVNEVLCNEELE